MNIRLTYLAALWLAASALLLLLFVESLVARATAFCLAAGA